MFWLQTNEMQKWLQLWLSLESQMMKDLKSNFAVIISWNLNLVEIVEKNYGKMKEYAQSVDGKENKVIQNNQSDKIFARWKLEDWSNWAILYMVRRNRHQVTRRVEYCADFVFFSLHLQYAKFNNKLDLTEN